MDERAWVRLALAVLFSADLYRDYVPLSEPAILKSYTSEEEAKIEAANYKSTKATRYRHYTHCS